MGSPILWFGDALKALKNKLFFSNDVSVETGSLNPTSSAVSANTGSLYISTSTGLTYRKTDNGSSTNWVAFDDSTNEIPSGGTTGQSLLKVSDTSYDVAWTDIEQIPSGGTTGQVLAKASNTNYDVEWASGSIATNGAAAWVSFNATGTLAIYDSYNVSGVTDNNPGDFTVNIDVDLPTVNYAVVIAKSRITANGNAPINETINSSGSATVAPTVDAFRIYYTSSGVGNLDPVYCSAMAFSN